MRMKIGQGPFRTESQTQIGRQSFQSLRCRQSASRAFAAGVWYACSRLKFSAALGTFQTFGFSRVTTSTAAVMPGRNIHSPVTGSFWFSTSITVVKKMAPLTFAGIGRISLTRPTNFTSGSR
jgi:hypothetical protein